MAAWLSLSSWPLPSVTMMGSKMDCRTASLKLVFHLPAAGFGLAQVAHADGEAVDLGGDGAEVVAGTPLDARVEISLTDALCASRDLAQRLDDGIDGDRARG